MAIIPSFFMDSVIALGVMGADGQKHWIGTGFLMGRKETDEPAKSTVYIITNKHVVSNHEELFVRFSTANTNGVRDLPMRLLDHGHKMYTEHPMQHTDVVAIQILPQKIIENQLVLHFFDKDDHALTLEQMKNTGVNEGNLVYALGFPMNLVNNTVKAPICRLGCISRVADAFVNPQNAEMFLVDAQAYPGNSGGPIISRPELISIEGTPNNTRSCLLGVLSGYIPYRDTLISQQTGQSIMIREENSGLTIVHPVDRIKEAIELEWNRVEKMRAIYKISGNQNNQEKREEVGV